MHDTLIAFNAAIPDKGTKPLTAKEIGEALQLNPDDLKRFIPLVVEASISSVGDAYLRLKEEFEFKPTPDAKPLLIKLVFKGGVTPGKLEVEEGLQAIVSFLALKANISVIEDATENGVAGVRVTANLGKQFFPLV
jgi:hypothetical protein